MAVFAYFDPQLGWEDVLRSLVGLMFVLLIVVPAFVVIAFLVYLVRAKRFSLRDLFWLTLVVGCLLGWWHDRDSLYWQGDWYKQQEALTRQQSRRILEAVRAAGFDADVDRDGQFDGLTRRAPTAIGLSEEPN